MPTPDDYKAARDMLIALRNELQVCSEQISGEDYNNPALNDLIERMSK